MNLGYQLLLKSPP